MNLTSLVEYILAISGKTVRFSQSVRIFNTSSSDQDGDEKNVVLQLHIAVIFALARTPS